MKYTHTGPRAQQQGFTLVELGISMVLIASMVLAGFYVVKRIRTDAAINAAIASANVSMNKANAAFSGSDSTDGANMTTLAANDTQVQSFSTSQVATLNTQQISTLFALSSLGFTGAFIFVSFFPWLLVAD